MLLCYCCKESYSFHHFRGLFCNFEVISLICIFLWLASQVDFFCSIILYRRQCFLICSKDLISFLSLVEFSSSLYLLRTFSLFSWNTFQFSLKIHLKWTSLKSKSWLFQKIFNQLQNTTYIWCEFPDWEKSQIWLLCSWSWLFHDLFTLQECSYLKSKLAAF